MKKLLLIAILLIIMLMACEKTPPVINDIFWQFVFHKDITLNTEAVNLTLYLNLSDEDGIDDIETIYFFNDTAELYWEINANTWEKVIVNDQTWLGVNQIRMEDYSFPPAGEYRIVLKDLGGETAERDLTILPGTIKKNFPSLTIKDGQLTVKGNQESYALWVYDKNDKFISEFYCTDNEALALQEDILAKANIPQDAYFDIYYFDTRQNAGFRTGPYYFSNPE